MKKIILLNFFIFLVLSNVYAEIITLKSGKVVEGKIVKRNEDFIKVAIIGSGGVWSDIEITYYMDEIEKINETNVENMNNIENEAMELEIKKKHFRDETLKSEKSYKDDKKPNIIKTHYKNGNIKTEFFKENGLYEGEGKVYHSNGNLSQVYHFKKGKYDGVRKSYDNEENLIKEQMYKGGKLNGFTRTYDKDGRLRSEEFYKNNLINGRSKYFDKDGKLLPDWQRKNIQMSHMVDAAGGNMFYDEDLMRRIAEKKREDNDFVAKSSLQTLSRTAEAYAKRNDGLYAANMQILLSINSSVDRYCGNTFADFVYDCEFSTNGYTFSATPTEIGVTGTTTFVIKTGGILTVFKSDEKFASNELQKTIKAQIISNREDTFNVNEKNKMNERANKAFPRKILRLLSTATEIYAIKNNGRYPYSKQAISAASGDVNYDYCDKTLNGFKYSCTFSTTGYTFKAIPTKKALSEKEMFVIKTGGLLSIESIE